MYTYDLNYKTDDYDYDNHVTQNIAAVANTHLQIIMLPHQAINTTNGSNATNSCFKWKSSNKT